MIFFSCFINSKYSLGFKNCFIFLLGDVDEDGTKYQCSINDNIYKPNVNTQYIKFIKAYRFEPELNEKLLLLRKYMKDFKNDILLLKHNFNKLFKDRFFNSNVIKFNKEDIGISPNDDIKKNNKLTNYFIEKGSEPQYYIKNTNIHKNELRGARIYNIKNTNNYEMKLFKTIHSFQGRELTENNKIIIFLGGNLFDYNLLYTAVSRAKKLNQIYLINRLK